MLGNVDALLATASYDDKGLVPVIAQDAATGVVRMFAWATAEALRATAESGFATFYSRSRKELWQKGATSGNVLRVLDIRIDCDGDAVLYLVDADGPSCHTGKTSCFFRAVEKKSDRASGLLVEDDGPAETPGAILARVEKAIDERRKRRPEESYVASLLAAGWPKILGKIKEESEEAIESLPTSDKTHTSHEAADLIFHLLVGLEAAD